jgi:hypothetical protein
LPSCQGLFSVVNYIEGTGQAQIGSSPWSVAGVGGGGATTVSGTPDTAPDGSATAARVTFGSISSNTQASALTQSVGSSAFAGYYNWTSQAWVKVVTQPVPGYMSFWIWNEGSGFQGTLSNSQNYVTVKIPADGQWHLLANYIPANWVIPGHHTVTIGFGYDGRDTVNQPSAAGGTTPGVLDVWEPQFAQGHSEGGKGWPFVANSSTTAISNPQPFVLQCPASIAFRDFSQFKPLITALNNNHGVAQITAITANSGNGYTLNNAGVSYYERGGTGDPFIGSPTALQASGTYAGQYCGFASVTDGTVSGSSGNHNGWPGSVLYCGKNMASLTEAVPGSPQILIPGYTLATCTTASCGGTSPCTTTCSTAQNNTNLTYNPANGQMTATVTNGALFPVGTDVVVAGITNTSVTGTNIGTVGITGSPSPPWQVVANASTTVTFQLVGALNSANEGTVVSGGSYTTSTNGTITGVAPWNSYTLHGSWLPQMTTGANKGKACQAWGVYYAYCLLFSAQSATNGNGGNNIFLAYSNTIDSGYCVWGVNQLCNNGSPTAASVSLTQPTGLMVTPNSNITTGQLPTVVCLPVGCPSTGTLYAITPPSNQNFLGFVLWQSPVGDGVHWKFAGWVTQPEQGATFTGTPSNGTTTLTTSSVLGPIQNGQLVTASTCIPAGTTLTFSSGTAGGAGTYTLSQNATCSTAQAMTSTWPISTPWDIGASRIDPFAFINGCGFGEFAFTSYKGSEWQPYTGGTSAKKDQAISYAVFSDVRGPFYILNNALWAPLGAGNGTGPVTPTGAILPLTSPTYNSLSTIGEDQFYEDALGNFNGLWNTDSGGGFSSGVGAFMPNACAAGH